MLKPHRLRQHVNSDQPQATAQETKSRFVLSSGSVRVDASLPVGVVVGNGRGKLLPMRACGRGYTNACGGGGASFREPQFLSIALFNFCPLVTRFVFFP